LVSWAVSWANRCRICKRGKIPGQCCLSECCLFAIPRRSPLCDSLGPRANHLRTATSKKARAALRILVRQAFAECERLEAEAKSLRAAQALEGPARPKLGGHVMGSARSSRRGRLADEASQRRPWPTGRYRLFAMACAICPTSLAQGMSMAVPASGRALSLKISTSTLCNPTGSPRPAACAADPPVVWSR